MGYSISWLAVRGGVKAEVERALGLVDTGATEDFPEAPICGLDLPGGWYLLVLDDCFHRFVMPDNLAALSRGTALVGCQVEEHEMLSTAFFWRDGVLEWEVAHEANKGLYHLDIDGTPPDSLAEIEARQREEQDAAGGQDAEIDAMFDVPVELARSSCG